MRTALLGLLHDLVDAPGEETVSSSAAAALQAAELYWVTAPMGQLAREVAEHRWLQDDRPASCGLMLFEDGLGDVPVWRTGQLAAAQAITWGPHPDGLLLTFLITRREAQRLRGGSVTAKFPPVVPGFSMVVPVEDDYRPLTDLSLPITRRSVAVIQAAWLLLDMPGIAATTQTTPPPSTSASHVPRDARSEPTVTVIQVRRQQPSGHGTAQGHFHHRWVVRLHKRWQACGPGRSQRRRILVRPYIKGPSGAPLLHREHVTVWNR